VEFFLNFTALLTEIGQAGRVLPESLRVLESDPNGALDPVPFQYDPLTEDSGDLIFILAGTTRPSTTRHYYIYFDIHGTFEAAMSPIHVELADDVPDEGQLAYRIDTPGATWFYQKEAGGFSSLLDIDGNDWLNFHPFGGSDGVYRGIPNLVHPDNIFHPGHANCTSRVLHAGPLRVTIHTVSNNGLWECLWEIYPYYARLTILQTADQGYWFLYEGTPGGLLDLTTDFCVRSNGMRTDMTQPWTSDIPGPEWLYFEDSLLNRHLYFVHEENDAEIDSFYQMQENMTVFGFGRNGLTKYLEGAPRHFTVGLADDATFETARKTIEAAYQGVTVTTGDLLLLPDLTQDSHVDAADLAILAGSWLTSVQSERDLTGDDSVDLKDFARLAQYWSPLARHGPHLQGCWSFDADGNDIAYDTSVFGRHGIIIGATRASEGTPGGALEFDGRDDHVQIKGYKGVLGAQPRTVAMWIRTQATGEAFLSWGADEPGGQWAISLTRGSRTQRAGALHVDIGGASAQGKTSINDGQWHHLAVVLAGSDTSTGHKIALYVDGKVNEANLVPSVSVNTVAGADVTLGASLGTARSFFSGALDEVRIYDRALPATEIQDLAAVTP
jgi:hypothetical protein